MRSARCFGALCASVSLSVVWVQGPLPWCFARAAKRAGFAWLLFCHLLWIHAECQAGTPVSHLGRLQEGFAGCDGDGVGEGMDLGKE